MGIKIIFFYEHLVLLFNISFLNSITLFLQIPEISAADGAVTFLNLAAVLSDLGEHKEAEKTAEKAVRKSEQDILSLSSTTQTEYKNTKSDIF